MDERASTNDRTSNPTGPTDASAADHGSHAGAGDAAAPGQAEPPGQAESPGRAARSEKRTLRRSRSDRIVSGLCGGLGDFFRVDSTLFRVAFVLLALAGGGGLILYLVMALIVPSEDEGELGTGETIRRGAEDLADSVKGLADGLQDDGDRSRRVGAILLILLGAYFLFRNLDWLGWFDAGWVWPILLIGLGVWLLVRRR